MSRSLAVIWTFFVFVVVLLFSARLAMWVGYAGHDRIAAVVSFWPAFSAGLRYDAAMAAVCALMLLIAWLPLHVLPKVRKSRAAIAALRTLATVFILVIALLSVAEYFFYAFYKTRFDPIVFGFFDDDTRAILITIWSDYPVLRVLVGLVVLVVAIYWLLRHVGQRIEPKLLPNKPVLASLAILGHVLVLALLARGSFGLFPLIRQDVTNSPDPFVRAAALNAPITIYKALRGYLKDANLDGDPSKGLARYGFSSMKEVATVLQLPNDNPATLREAMFEQAPARVDAVRKPHVVLAVLESFGADLLASDDPVHNDMLGRLRPHLKQDYQFDNFIAGQNGTHPELENIVFGSPITPLTSGRYGQHAFASSAALPFKKAGYRTAFIRPGFMSWRGFGRALTHNGFDKTYDSNDINARYSDARGTDWGAYDEHVLKLCMDLLADADKEGQPLFIIVLTATNHPPYTLKTPHAELPLDPARLGPRANPNTHDLRAMMSTYQYQADQFGAFMTRLKASPLADHTLVMAAGDHNLRTHFHYTTPEQQPDIDRVFAYAYLPPAWQPTEPVDNHRMAGHADLMPTLVSRALPGARFFASGVDLFSPGDRPGYGLASFERLYLPAGMVAPLTRPSLYRWKTPHTLDDRPETMDASIQSQLQWAAARTALRDWFIRDDAGHEDAAGLGRKR